MDMHELFLANFNFHLVFEVKPSFRRNLDHLENFESYACLFLNFFIVFHSSIMI